MSRPEAEVVCRTTQDAENAVQWCKRNANGARQEGRAVFVDTSDIRESDYINWHARVGEVWERYGDKRGDET